MRTIAWNLGVACAALSAAVGAGPLGSALARIGWGLVLAGAVWLGVVILLPAARTDRPGLEKPPRR